MNNNIRNRAGIAGLAVVISLAVCLTPVGRVTGNTAESSGAAAIQASAQIASFFDSSERDGLQSTGAQRFSDLLPAMLNRGLDSNLSVGRAAYGTSEAAGAGAQNKGAHNSLLSLTISNPAPITINDNAAATPYPSTITVAGLSGVINKVTVTLTNINHTFPDDIDILLVGPTGQKTILMSDAGNTLDLVNVTLTFDDVAASFLPDNAQIVTGTFKPTDFEPGDPFPAPAPAGPYPAALSGFNGTNPNGTWSLYVVDDAATDFGNINGGWSLTIDSSV